MSLYSITESVLKQEILKIDDRAEYLTKLKDIAIQNLLVKKQSILEGEDVGISEESLETTIKEIQSQHSTLMKQYEPRQTKVHECKTSIERLQLDVEEIERELEIIKNRHEVAIKLLLEKKLFLQLRLNSIQNLDMAIAVLEQTILDRTNLHASDIQLLQAQRQKLLKQTDLGPEIIAELLERIEQEISNKEQANISEINKLEEEVLNMKNDMSENVEILSAKLSEIQEELDRLEAMKVNATPSQLIEIEKQIAALHEEYEEYKHLISLMELTSSEKLIKLLEDHKLKITPSGRIQTGSGRIITLNEARELGLLEGIESSILLKLEQMITAIANYEEASEPTTATSEGSSTTLSGLSSSDVHYLKHVLGRPLTLALAEITAKQPRDPIHYLAHWLMKFRYNEESGEIKKQELLELDNERKRIAALTLRQNAEEGTKAALMDLLGYVEEEVERHRILKELERIEAESAFYEEHELKNLELEATDTFGDYTGPTSGQKL